MPIYSYQCEKCGNPFDLLEGMTAEKVVRKCPVCGSKKVRKKMSGFSVGGSSGGSGISSCPTGTCPF
jgi:putative FmdB family regulatory protein